MDAGWEGEGGAVWTRSSKLRDQGLGRMCRSCEGDSKFSLEHEVSGLIWRPGNKGGCRGNVGAMYRH